MPYEEITIRPIGTVRNRSQKSGRAAGTWLERVAEMKAQADETSEIVIDGISEEALKHIEDFSHITVVYWAHLTDAMKLENTVKVHPMGNPEFPEVGVLASRSPVRPNPILITTVCLRERKGNVLIVTGLDALDGSPVLDIKPYTPERGALKYARIPDWMSRISREYDDAER